MIKHEKGLFSGARIGCLKNSADFFHVILVYNKKTGILKKDNTDLQQNRCNTEKQFYTLFGCCIRKK